MSDRVLSPRELCWQVDRAKCRLIADVRDRGKLDVEFLSLLAAYGESVRRHALAQAAKALDGVRP